MFATEHKRQRPWLLKAPEHVTKTLFTQSTKACEKDLGYSKHQRLDGLAFTMHRKQPELTPSCLSQMILKKEQTTNFWKIFIMMINLKF